VQQLKMLDAAAGALWLAVQICCFYWVSLNLPTAECLRPAPTVTHQGLSFSLALCAWCLCGSFGWLVLCVATAKRLLGAADVTVSCLSLQI
jgi:hypothetical protein